MNIQDQGQVESITNLFVKQYPKLLPAFEAVLAELKDTRTEISLSELKQLALERTEPYKTQLQHAVVASQEECLVSDLISDDGE